MHHDLPLESLCSQIVISDASRHDMPLTYVSGCDMPEEAATMPSNSAALRVYQPLPNNFGSESQGTARSTWTVQRAIEAYIDEVMTAEKKAAKTTKQQYRTVARRWGEFGEFLVNTHRCTSPMRVSAVDSTAIKQFRAWVLDTAKGNAVNRTANKYLAVTKTVLAWLADEGEIDEAPKFPEPLTVDTAAAKLYLDHDEISAVYQKTSLATWPRRDGDLRALTRSAGTYWRAMLVLWFHYGFDTQVLVSYEAHKPALTWRNVTFDSAYPLDDCKVENEHGWIWYVRPKTKRKKPQPLVLPLTAISAAHLRSIMPVNPDPTRPIFHFPRSRPSLDSQWQRLCAEAGAQPKPDLQTGAARHYTFKHLRKTCATYHDANVPGLSPLVLGHAKRELSEITFLHYTHPAIALVEAFASLPQPEAFSQIFEPVDRQQLLFD